MITSSDGFHLTLPSDGSHETFPDNTLSHYKTRLPQPIDLTDGEWEMGLTEMIYPTSLDNITTKENYVDLLIPWQQRKNVKDPNGSTTDRFKLEKMGGQTNHLLEHTIVPWRDSYWHQNFTLLSVGVFQIFRIHFRSGPYPQAQGLVDEINLGISRCLQDVYADLGDPKENTEIKLVYSKHSERITYVQEGKRMIENFPFAIRFPVDLAYKLGMGEKAFDIFDYSFFHPSGVYSKWINVEYSFPHIVDLYLNMKQKYVYCDVAEPQIVGSNALKLLRVIPMPIQRERQGGEGTWEPRRIQYHKLSKKYFDTIEIQINSHLGDPIPFNYGKVILVVHFRKVY